MSIHVSAFWSQLYEQLLTCQQHLHHDIRVVLFIQGQLMSGAVQNLSETTGTFCMCEGARLMLYRMGALKPRGAAHKATNCEKFLKRDESSQLHNSYAILW